MYAGAPARWVVAFLGGVACIFAPIGVLFASKITPDRSARAMLIVCLISGALAVCWAAAFTLSRWFLVGVAAFTGLIVAVNTPLLGGALHIPTTAPSWHSLLMVALLATGYVLFVLYLSVQGRRTIELQKEMRLARQIHDTLVPDIHHAGERVEVVGVSAPSSAMGGDLIDLVDRADGLDIILADVSGHGVRAGIVMGMLKAAMRAELRRAEPLGALIGALNDTIAEVTPSNVFATMIWLRVSPCGSSAEVCLAGHHPALLIRNGAIERYDNHHLPLGVALGERFEPRRITLLPGDLFVCYTDGLIEAMDSDGRQFGINRVDQSSLELADRPLEQIASGMLERVRAHGPQTDDQSILLMRVRTAV